MAMTGLIKPPALHICTFFHVVIICPHFISIYADAIPGSIFSIPNSNLAILRDRWKEAAHLASSRGPHAAGRDFWSVFWPAVEHTEELRRRSGRFDYSKARRSMPPPSGGELGRLLALARKSRATVSYEASTSILVVGSFRSSLASPYGGFPCSLHGHSPIPLIDFQVGLLSLSPHYSLFLNRKYRKAMNILDVVFGTGALAAGGAPKVRN